MSDKDKPEDDLKDGANESELDPSNMGELILKNAALTMSSKGISSDLKEVIKIKVDYVCRIYADTKDLAKTFLSCKDTKVRRESIADDGILGKMLDHVLAEVFVTNIILNNILTSFITKEQNIREEQKNMIIEDIGKMIAREMENFKK